MIHWQQLPSTTVVRVIECYRAAVPGGWLVLVKFPKDGPSLTFYPDPDHSWDGSSLP